MNKTTKLRVQTKLDTRFKESIRKFSTYGGKQGGILADRSGKFMLITYMLVAILVNMKFVDITSRY